LLKICDNDQEYYYQQQIREKMQGIGLPLGRSKGEKNFTQTIPFKKNRQIN
jgi:hypothetical protein